MCFVDSYSMCLTCIKPLKHYLVSKEIKQDEESADAFPSADRIMCPCTYWRAFPHKIKVVLASCEIQILILFLLLCCQLKSVI